MITQNESSFTRMQNVDSIRFVSTTTKPKACAITHRLFQVWCSEFSSLLQLYCYLIVIEVFILNTERLMRKN